MRLVLQAKTNQRQLLGFTLIELLVVLAIFGIILFILLPTSTRSFRNLQLEDTARSVTSLMNYIRNRAILERTTYKLNFDDTDSSYWVSVKIDSKFQEFKNIKNSLFSNKKLGANLRISSLIIKQEDFLDKEESSICFYPDGSMDESELILSGPSGNKIIIETNLSGKINVIKE